MHVTPVKVALLNPDGTAQGDWIDYQQALKQRGGACSMDELLSYDCFQADTDGITPIGGDTDCGLPMPSTRWSFTDDQCISLTADDFTLKPGHGDTITRITGAFEWIGDGNPANSENCFILIRIYDDIDSTCSGPAVSNILGLPIAMSLGNLQYSPGFYYTFDVDICALLLTPNGIPAPTDGSGGVQISILQSYNLFTGASTPATCAQPMLWGTAANRPGSQSNLPYWGDADHSNAFDPGTECFDFTGSVPCPDNLGNMIALYTNDPCDGVVCADANADGVVFITDAEPLIEAIQDPVQYVIDYATDPLCSSDTDLSGDLNNFDIGPFLHDLDTGMGCGTNYAPSPQSVRLFLAEEGLSDPNDEFSAAVTPQLVNPEISLNNAFPKRLYLWIDLEIANTEIKGFSFNVQTSGQAVITEAVLYNMLIIPAFSLTWNSSPYGLVQATDTSGNGTRWSGANAMAVFEPGASNGMFAVSDPHYNAATGARLLGHIEVQGSGEVFLEIGDKGIASVYDSPGPDISLGFGDEADGLNGASYNTGSSMADATARCVGDLNGDLVVDTADLGILLSQFGMSGSADLNNDGAVDTADLGILLAQFNTTCGAVI
ncbi:MAG: hypothetical protein H6813_00330 [Phycisphaeraceae bacterium]|nr:hypothetical protein [Phycisphaeraceae bacterium]MCB9847469.1 hypothetical protein [Phycisphaeraceae bacterium]